MADVIEVDANEAITVNEEVPTEEFTLEESAIDLETQESM